MNDLGMVLVLIGAVVIFIKLAVYNPPLGPEGAREGWWSLLAGLVLVCAGLLMIS